MTNSLMGPMPRTFVLYRKVDDTGVSGTGVVAWGVQFPDGKVVTRWRATEVRQTCVWENINEVTEVHGHGGNTIVLWND